MNKVLSALATVIKHDQMPHFLIVSQSPDSGREFESIQYPTAINKDLGAACSGTKTDGRILMRRNDPPRIMRLEADSGA